MTAPRPDPTPASLSTLHALVEEGVEEIVERWMQAVADDRRVLGHREIDGALLRDAAPEVLREILSVLTEPGHEVRAERLAALTRHGARRADQHFAIDELVREYQLLREELFAFLQERFSELEGISRDDLFLVFRMVGHALDDALRWTAHAFVETYTERLRHLSRTDSLTGLLNHRTFYERLEEEVEKAQERERSLVVTLVDLDRFKSVNEARGHVYGDRLLRDCAVALRDSLRAEDVVCRYGGDEMAVIFPRAGIEQVEILLNRVRESFRVTAERLDAPPSFGFSHGSAVFPLDGTSAGELVQVADQRLRDAKRRKEVERPLGPAGAARAGSNGGGPDPEDGEPPASAGAVSSGG